MTCDEEGANCERANYKSLKNVQCAMKKLRTLFSIDTIRTLEDLSRPVVTPLKLYCNCGTGYPFHHSSKSKQYIRDTKYLEVYKADPFGLK